MPFVPDTYLMGMSLRDKVAQLIVPKIEGLQQQNDEEYERLLLLAKEFSFGGYILFRGGVPETAERINSLYQALKTPPLFMSDMERGPGQQIEDLFNLPHAMAFAATGDTDLAYRAGDLTGKSARAAGVPMILTPVVDVLTNLANPIIGLRTFSDDPEKVSEYASSFARGLVAGGALPTIKHFPGHGDTSADSHIELPVIEPDMKRLNSIELYPFRKVIEDIECAVMVGHLAVDSIAEEKGIPASCSDKIVNGLLRKELGFDGLVITDALMMGAVTSRFSTRDALKRCLLAGCDLLLYPPDPVEALELIEQLVRCGEVKEEVIDRSVSKILASKNKLGLFESGQSCDLKTAQSSEYELLGRDILQRAVTLMRNENEIVPLSDFSNLLIATIDDDGATGNTVESGVAFTAVLDEVVEKPDGIVFTPESSDSEIESLLGLAQNYEKVVIAVFSRPRAWKGNVISEQSASILYELTARVEKSTVIVFGGPNIIDYCENADAVLCTFDNSVVAEEVAADALLGRIPVAGKLPVRISEKLPRGFGLDRMLLRQE